MSLLSCFRHQQFKLVVIPCNVCSLRDPPPRLRTADNRLVSMLINEKFQEHKFALKSNKILMALNGENATRNAQMNFAQVSGRWR